MSKQKITLFTLATTTPKQFLRGTVSYSLGGINYFTGNSYKRGYYTDVYPVEIDEHSECHKLTFGGGAKYGLRGFMEEANRFNARKLESLSLQLIDDVHFAKMFKQVLDATGLTLHEDSLLSAARMLQLAAQPASAPAPSGREVVKPKPYTIRTIIEQLGGAGISGALVYCGADQAKLRWKCPQADGEYRGHSDGCEAMLACPLDMPESVGIEFPVNGKDGEDWHMAVTYECNDTYTVRLFTKSPAVTFIETFEDAYGDNLKDVVENMYDRAIKNRNEGFINLH